MWFLVLDFLKGKPEAQGRKQVEDISPDTIEVATTLSSVASLKPNTVSEQVSIGSAKRSIPSPGKGQRARKAPMISEETLRSPTDNFTEESYLAEAINGNTLQKEDMAKQVHLDSLLAQRIAEEEELNEQQKKRKAQSCQKLSRKCTLQGEDFAKKMVDLVNQRKKYFAEERARAKRNKPMTQSQLKTYMMNYLKNQGTWKLSQLKNLSFEEVKEEFDKLVKQVESFAPMNFEATKASLKRFGEELQTKTPKRMKDDEAKDDEPTKKSGKRRKQMARRGLHTDIDKDDSEGSDEVDEQEESVTGTKIPINPVPVAMKTPSIATYKIIKQGEKGAYQIVREDGTDIVYINFGAMLKSISRDDLTELYRIVMNRYGMDGPEDKLEKIFWKYLKDMFEEPLSTDPVWSLLSQQRIISWRYYDTCRVHCLNLESMDIYMLSERKYPLSAESKWLTGKETSNPFKIFNDSPLTGVNTPGSDENRLKLYDLMYKIVNVADMMEYPKPRTFTDEQAYSSGDEVGRDHIPTASALKSTYAPPQENSLLAQTGDMAIFIDWYNVSKPLPLGGEPGHVTIQPDFFFNKDLEYLRYGRKVGRPALSISKMKAAYYPDVGLEQLVPDQFWIEAECKYDIAAMYGDRRAVRTHMRILSVVRIEVFSMYGYDYMKKIILRRADLKEYVIAERDFKYMYPSDFEDLYLLNLQGHLNHLSPDDKKVLTTAINLWTRNLVIRQRVEDFQLGIESYQTQLNLTKPRWDATGFEFKHDYTVIDSPRAVTFRDRYGVQMILRFNEMHKFSDGTLQQIDARVGTTRVKSQSQQDKSKDEYKILDEERRCQKQGVHVCYPETAKDTTYLPESGELCWWTDSRRRLPVTEENRMRGSISYMFKDCKKSFALSSVVLPNIEWITKVTHNEDGNPSRANIKQALVGDMRDPLWIKLVTNGKAQRWSVLTNQEDQAKMEMETPRSSGVNSPPNAHT
ncbi:hypothetical protein Tco_0807622 [Tanacetum coccineum]